MYQPTCSKVGEQGRTHCRIVCGSKKLETNVPVHREGLGDEVSSIHAAGRRVEVKSVLNDDLQSIRSNRIVCRACSYWVKRRVRYIEQLRPRISLQGCERPGSRGYLLGRELEKGGGRFLFYPAKKIYFLLSCTICFKQQQNNACTIFFKRQ